MLIWDFSQIFLCCLAHYLEMYIYNLKIWNTETEALRLLCCCAPAYEHSDTVITEPAGSLGTAGGELRNDVV